MILIWESRSTGRRTCHTAMLYTKKSHADWPAVWTWTPMVTCWELTASAMAWLLDCWNTRKDLRQFWLKFEPGILWRLCTNADHCNATFSQGQI